jgi:hypothetical protein
MPGREIAVNAWKRVLRRAQTEDADLVKLEHPSGTVEIERLPDAGRECLITVRRSSGLLSTQQALPEDLAHAVGEALVDLF